MTHCPQRALQEKKFFSVLIATETASMNRRTYTFLPQARSCGYFSVYLPESTAIRDTTITRQHGRKPNAVHIPWIPFPVFRSKSWSPVPDSLHLPQAVSRSSSPHLPTSAVRPWFSSKNIWTLFDAKAVSRWIPRMTPTKTAVRNADTATPKRTAKSVPVVWRKVDSSAESPYSSYNINWILPSLWSLWSRWLRSAFGQPIFPLASLLKMYWPIRKANFTVPLLRFSVSSSA